MCIMYRLFYKWSFFRRLNGLCATYFFAQKHTLQEKLSYLIEWSDLDFFFVVRNTSYRTHWIWISKILILNLMIVFLIFTIFCYYNYTYIYYMFNLINEIENQILIHPLEDNPFYNGKKNYYIRLVYKAWEFFL